MRLFLGAHRTRLVPVGIEQPRFLVDGAAILDDFDLASRFVFDRLTDEADRVHVLDLATGAERFSRLAYADVDVGPQRSLLHVAIAGAEIAQDRAQLGDIRLGLLGGADVRLGDDLHQRYAGAVEIDERQCRALVVQRLAGVLFQMQPLDPDGGALTAGEFDRDLALAHDRRLVLADLISLRQIRIKVVLAVEHRAQIDLRIEAEPGAHRLPDAFLVDDGQHARHRRIDQRNMRVRLAAEFGRGARKQFRVRGNLGVDLEPDDDFPVPGGALDQIGWFNSDVHE